MFPMRVYSGWEKIETLGRDVFGGEIIHVTAKNPEGKGIEGICSASVMVFNLYYVNMANAYALTMMTAPEGELSSWITVFEHIYGSIVYSQRYQSELNKQLVASGQATMEISKLCSQMNKRYSWVKFYVDDEDNTVTLADDAVVDPSTCGDEAYGLMFRMMLICDDAYPEFMRTLYA